jgi:hypothetical protein
LNIIVTTRRPWVDHLYFMPFDGDVQGLSRKLSISEHTLYYSFTFFKELLWRAGAPVSFYDIWEYAACALPVLLDCVSV